MSYLSFLCLLFFQQSNGQKADSCERDDFFLRKISKRYLSLPTDPVVKSSIKTYQQCFGQCKQLQCSSFNFQKLGEDDFKCSIYAGENEGRFYPSARFSAKTIDLLFFERLPCQEAEHENETQLKGSFPLAKDCQDVQKSGGKESGIYEIANVVEVASKTNNDFQYAFCNMEVLGGGWTIIQHNAGEFSFNKNWQEYKQGFGDYRKSFWAGNELIHQLTKNEDTELLVILTDASRADHHAYYKKFHVADEQNRYQLHIGKYSDEPSLKLHLLEEGDRFMHHNHCYFSTHDKDITARKCTNKYQAGWWFKECYYVFLNGNALESPCSAKGIVRFHSVRGDECYIEATMMVRKKAQ